MITLLAIVVTMVLIPFVVYFSAKLGTYGVLRAKQRFDRFNNKEI